MQIHSASELSDDDLFGLYAHPTGLVRANMVSTLDGAAQDTSGLSDGLSSPVDKRIFGILRALCDVVLVGAGTVRAEGYGPARINEQRKRVRRELGLADLPTIAVVSRTCRLDVSTPFFTEAVARPIVVTVEAAPVEDRAKVGERADVLVAGEDSVDLISALNALRDRGLTRVLSEGGPHLLNDLAATGELDELCLSLRLALVGGDAGRITAGPALPATWSAKVAHAISDDTHLFLRLTRE